MNDFDDLYIASVYEPDTCAICGYIVKYSKTKTRVVGCPVLPTREKAVTLAKKLARNMRFIFHE